MIDIPIGKALVAVEGSSCKECYFGGLIKYICDCIVCDPEERKDKNGVIFRLMDYPPKGKIDET